MQGRSIGSAELAQVRGLLAAHPDWSRYRLSRDLCQVWNWRSLTGQIKDMPHAVGRKVAARGQSHPPPLLQLEQQCSQARLTLRNPLCAGGRWRGGVSNVGWTRWRAAFQKSVKVILQKVLPDGDLKSVSVCDNADSVFGGREVGGKRAPRAGRTGAGLSVRRDAC